MKVLMLSLVFCSFVMPSAFAESEKPAAKRKIAAVECPSDGEILMKQVEGAKSCGEAAQIAENCMWGSSFDVGLAGAAAAVCEKDFKKINKQDKANKEHALKRCGDKYAKAEGSLSRSMHSFCRLNVYKFWSDIYTPVEN